MHRINQHKTSCGSTRAKRAELGLKIEAFAPLALAGPYTTQINPRDPNAPDSTSISLPQRFDTPHGYIGTKNKNSKKILLVLRLETFAPLTLEGSEATQINARDLYAPDSTSTSPPQCFDTPQAYIESKNKNLKKIHLRVRMVPFDPLALAGPDAS